MASSCFSDETTFTNLPSEDCCNSALPEISAITAQPFGVLASKISTTLGNPEVIS